MPDSLSKRWRTRRQNPTIFLHIGAMKSGTTYLQQLVSDNREALASAGIGFPGSSLLEQGQAVRDILFEPADERMDAFTSGRWAKISGEMMAHRGISILSQEFLSYADRDGAERVVSSLGDADVRVILTVRDAKSVIPAQWQTSCRNGARLPYRSFVNGVASVIQDGDQAEGMGAKIFRRTQGIPRMLDVWLPIVGRKRFHVVTVPTSASQPSILWTRFASALGVDPGVVDIDSFDAPRNPSLGLSSSELLRLLNVELGALQRLDYDVIVKGALARTILQHRIPEERHLELNRRGVRLAATWNRLMRESITGSRVNLVGSLDDLPIHAPDPATPKALPQPTEEELLAAAATARDGLSAVVAKLEDLRRELDRAQGDGEPPVVNPRHPEFLDEGWMDRTSPHHWDDRSAPVSTAVSELAELVRRGIALYQDFEKVGLTVTSRA